MNDKIIWLARYEGFFRHVCRGIREGDGTCIKQSSHFYAAMLPERAVVIPMPGHTGEATTMLQVANEISKIRKDIRVWNGLHAVPHVSNYAQKRIGIVPDPIKMTARRLLLKRGEKPCIIDNVIVSGVTAQAALYAIGLSEALVFCLCKDMWR